MARKYRRIDGRYRTATLCAGFRGEWDAEPSHALIEAYADGWAWSVPLEPGFRHGQTGQLGDTAHGVLVDGHEGFLFAGKARPC